MNDLEKFFYQNQGKRIHKWRHYFEIYDRHFAHLRNKEVDILEIGVSQGGSLDMWRDYFGPKARIYGMDINPECKKFEAENIKILIGSQEDRNFLRSVKQQIPKLDLLIDDGGHTMKQQIVSFEELFDHVKVNGIYFLEDLQTSYYSSHGGGYKNKNSFIEYSKNFIDYIHGWHSEQKGRLDISSYTKNIYGLHYYDSVLVIEKKEVSHPHHQKTGHEVIPNYFPTRSFWQKVKSRLGLDKENEKEEFEWKE